MITFSIEKADVNVEALDAEVRAALAAFALGIAWDGQEVAVYLSDDATPVQVTQVQQMVEQHDSTRLTSRQQVEADRQARLEALRTDNAVALDETAYVDEPEIVQELARRVAWLEQEILALRAERV